MSASLLGFLRGLIYPIIGGALFGLCQYLVSNPYISAPVALLVTGLIAQIEHKLNIPTFNNNASSTTGRS